MKPCLIELKQKELDKLIKFNILETKEGKTSNFLHSIINIGTSFTYLKVGINVYQIFFSDGNFYPQIYRVHAWQYSYQPIDYYLFKKVDNSIKVTQYYADLNKYRKLN